MSTTDVPAGTQEPAAAPSAENTSPETNDPILAELGQDEANATPEAPKQAEGQEEGQKPTETEEEAPEATEGEEKPKGAEQRKDQLNTEIRDLVAQRNQLKAQVEAINHQVYEAQTPEELVQAGMSETDARLEALQQSLMLKDYNERVAEAQLTIETEAQRVQTEWPIFNPDSDSYNEELAQGAAQILADNLVFDQNSGQIIGSNISPYQLYQTIARAHEISSAQGQIQGQKSAEEMAANADTTGAASPTGQKKDPLLDILGSDD